MSHRSEGARCIAWGVAAVLTISLWSPGRASAQAPGTTPVEGTPPAGAPPVIGEPAAPTATPLGTEPAQPPPPMIPPPPATAGIAPPPAPPPTTPKPAINVGLGMRVGVRMQNPNEPDKLNDFGLDNGNSVVELRLSGEVTPMFGWQANFVANLSGAPSTGGPASVLDLIGKLDLHESFHIWAGRLLVPSDRSNFSGPWFMSAWNYPGFYAAGRPPLGPLTGPYGRDNGAVIWGQFVGGKAKYYAGAFGLDNVANRPYYSARINIALIGEEPGFYHSSTYYGAKDLLAIAGGLQFQQDGIAPDNNMLILMGDLLFEKNLGPAGVVTFESQYYHFKEGYNFAGESLPLPALPAPRHAFYFLGSYLTGSPVGIGRLQPLVRVQRTADPGWTIIDAFLSYVIDEYNLRMALGYQRTDLGGNTTAGNAIQLGLQIQR